MLRVESPEEDVLRHSRTSSVQEYRHRLGGAATVSALLPFVVLVLTSSCSCHPRGRRGTQNPGGCPFLACFLPSEFFNTFLPL